MIADVRDRVHQEAYGNLVKGAGRICPGCGCQAKANRSTATYTYFYFACGAQSYKQPRSQAAIQLLRQGPSTATVGCSSNELSGVRENLLSRDLVEAN